MSTYSNVFTGEDFNYYDWMINNIYMINSRRVVKDSGNLNEKVKKVAVVLCGSRNGSSLLKTVVSKSKDLAYLAGEEEPYFILSQNGFPYNSKSDAIKNINNKQHLLNCIFDELGKNIDGKVSITQLKKDWVKRFMLQFPRVTESKMELIEDLFSDILFKYWNEDNPNWDEVNQIFLSELLRNSNGIGFYDVIPENTNFLFSDVNRFKIEETPYVVPGFKENITEDDLEDKWLFFKTPQDCYRIGIFEELFPNAEIKYIHLTRGFAQSVNGLMDGWLSETGFFAHNMEIIKERLNIKGYSDVIKGGDRWWNFDLPPGWEDYKDKPLEEVCLFQWISAHKSILESEVDVLRIKFEDFLADNNKELKRLTDYLNISPITVKNLPVIMATNTPSPKRWMKREDIIMKLSEREDVKQMMNNLGYDMDPEKWI